MGCIGGAPVEERFVAPMLLPCTRAAHTQHPHFTLTTRYCSTAQTASFARERRLSLRKVFATCRSAAQGDHQSFDDHAVGRPLRDEAGNLQLACGERTLLNPTRARVREVASLDGRLVVDEPSGLVGSEWIALDQHARSSLREKRCMVPILRVKKSGAYTHGPHLTHTRPSNRLSVVMAVCGSRSTKGGLCRQADRTKQANR